MPLHLGLPHHSPAHNAQQKASREARRQLKDKVRSDWAYPDAPHHLQLTAQEQPEVADAQNAKATVAAHVDSKLATQAASFDFEPTDWAEREYSDFSSSEGEGEGDASAGPGSSSGGGAASMVSRVRGRTKADKADAVAERKLASKKRRQERLEAEMGWNIGLAHFSAQRNAWTCARTSRPVPSLPEETNGNSTGKETEHEGSTGEAMDVDGNPLTVPTTGRSVNPSNIAVVEDATVALPIPPKLLSDHPIRARIGTASYNDIYSKIILQGRTPTVPINLQDITSALIYGWKEEGNWPPKVGPPEPSVTKKKGATVNGSEASARHPHLHRGVQAVSKVLQNLTGGSGSSPNSHG